MKYYLIVGYQLLERYRNYPDIRISINQNLIDEFKCDNEESIKISMKDIFTEKIERDFRTITRKREELLTFEVPKQYKIYELDSKDWPQIGELLLEVNNNNSDYNNGFMKKRSIVSFDPVFLIKKDLLDNKETLRRIFEKYAVQDIRQQLTLGQGLPGNRHRHRWPGITAYPARGISFQRDPDLVRGGNFKISLSIKKRYGMYMLCAEQWINKGYLSIDRYFIAWYQRFKKIKLFFSHDAIMDARGDIDKVTATVKYDTNK